MISGAKKARGWITQRKFSQLAVGFSPDSAWLHVTGTDGEAIIYNLTEKEIVSHHKKHRGWLFDLTYNQSKNLIASASNDGSIQVWNPISNAVLAELRGHAGGVRHVAFVNQGTAILSASEDGTVRRWRVPARAAARPALVEEYRGDPVYSRDRARVALSGAGIFDVITGEVLQRGGPSYTGPGFLKFSDDGSLLLAFSRSAESDAQPDICLHDGLTGETLRCMLNRKTGNIWSADMDGEARTVVADVVDGEQRAIVSFDATTSRELGRLASRGVEFGEPVVSADGTRIFVRETNGPIRAFDRALAREVGTPIVASREFPLIHVHLPRRDRVILGWADGRAESRTLSNNELVTTFEFDSTWGQTIMPSPSEDFLVTRMRCGGLEVWNADSGKLVARLPAIGPDGFVDPMFLPGERYLAASSGATTVIWDLESGLELERFEMDFGGSHPSVFVKGYSADGSRIVTWSWTGPKQWLFQRDAYEVIASAQERISRCLHPEQRRRFGLVLVPPRWCITGAGKEGLSDPDSWQPKWPYHTEAWREWLAARDRGEERPLPQ